MSTTTTPPRPASVAAPQGESALASLKRHWVTGGLIAALAMLLGIGLALTQPTTYTGETRLAIGRGEMSALNIPGYPTAAKEMAANYSRWVTDKGVGGFQVPDGVTSVQGSPIPESSVIRIEAKANDADAAVKASQHAADALMNEVNKVRQDNDPNRVMDEIVKNAPELSKVNAGAAGTLGKYNKLIGDNASPAAIEAALEAYSKVDTQRAKLQAEQDARLDEYRRLISTKSTEADLRPIGQGAQLAGNDRASSMQRGALIGLGLGSLVALLVCIRLDRRRPKVEEPQARSDASA